MIFAGLKSGLRDGIGSLGIFRGLSGDDRPFREEHDVDARVHLSAANKADFGRQPLVATHNLHQSSCSPTRR